MTEFIWRNDHFWVGGELYRKGPDENATEKSQNSREIDSWQKSNGAAEFYNYKKIFVF